MTLNRKMLLLLALSLQLMVLLGMLAKAALPLWNGSELRLNTMPVDPRSLFRGNYAQLRYPISRIAAAQLPNRDQLRHGEQLYVSLSEDDNGIYQLAEVSLTQPASGRFIRGRLQLPRYRSNAEHYELKYGIEAWFAPKDKALAMERQLRKGAIAVLMISDNGVARLKSIEAPPQAPEPPLLP